jgi:hypothetical protein
MNCAIGICSLVVKDEYTPSLMITPCRSSGSAFFSAADAFRIRVAMYGM